MLVSGPQAEAWRGPAARLAARSGAGPAAGGAEAGGGDGVFTAPPAVGCTRGGRSDRCGHGGRRVPRLPAQENGPVRRDLEGRPAEARAGDGAWACLGGDEKLLLAPSPIGLGPGGAGGLLPRASLRKRRGWVGRREKHQPDFSSRAGEREAATLAATLWLFWLLPGVFQAVLSNRRGSLCFRWVR